MMFMKCDLNNLNGIEPFSDKKILQKLDKKWLLMHFVASLPTAEISVSFLKMQLIRLYETYVLDKFNSIKRQTEVSEQTWYKGAWLI